ncbi:MAG: carboxypeptidase regulatory-like domain-containing protein [Planctomycetes bacterium]|nr:carboxypeptidase regulatory-like domain-containing protein [Planctomycetota bacterium]
MSGWMKFVLVLAVAGILGGLVFVLSDDGAESEAAHLSSDPSGEVAAPKMGLAPAGEAREVQPLGVAETSPSAVQPSGAEAVAARGDEAAAVAPQVRLVGRLVDPSGRPVEGARVVVHLPGDGLVGLDPKADSDKKRPEATSRADGRFSVAFDLPSPDASRVEGFERRFGGGLTRLVAAHDAFVVLVHELPELHEGDLDVGTLALAVGAGVRGRVVDESGRPVVGAEIEAQHVVEKQGRDPFLGMFRGDLASLYTRAKSAADGRFTVHGVEPGAASLTARADGRRVGYVDDLELTVSSTVDVGDITLPKGGAIAGHVLSADGVPLEGAVVRVMSMQRIVIDELEPAPRSQLGQEWRLRAETDASGWFELAGLGTGTYTVRVEKQGFASSATDDVPVGTRDFSVRLDPLGELELTLVDARTRAPVDGARVVAVPRREGPVFVMGQNSPVDGPPADGSRPGVYLVHDVGPAGVDLEISAAGFASRSVEGPRLTGGQRAQLEVGLTKESVLAGLVVDHEGRGLSGAHVLLAEHEEPEASSPGEMRIERKISIGGGDEELQPWKRALTDDDGHFELHGIPAGSWDLRASADGHVRSEPLVVHLDPGDEQLDLRMVLEPAGSIAGVVVEEDGTPVRAAEVVVKAPAAPGADEAGDFMGLLMAGADSEGPLAPRRATTDVQGHFSVGELPPGRWIVQLSSGGGVSFGGGMMIVMDGAGSGVDDPRSRAEVTVTPGEEAFVRLIRPPTATLTGQVVAGGQGVPDVTLKLKQAASFMPFGGKTVSSDRFGNFTFEDVEPGRYELSGIVPKAANPETLEVELSAGRTETARLVFEGSTISGKVVDDETGAGVPDLLVEVNPVKQSKQSSTARMEMMFVTSDSGGGGASFTVDAGGTKSRVTTDSEGRFEALFVKPGDYELVVSGGGYAEARSDMVSVEDGQDKDNVAIRIGRGAVLIGTVVSGDTGQMLDGVPVSLRPAGGGGGDSQMTMTEAGSYRFEGLSAGEYSVSVLGSGFGGQPLANETVRVEKGEQRTLDLRTQQQDG